MTERSMVRAMCEVCLKDGKEISCDGDVGFETTDHLAVAISVGWYGHVLRRTFGLCA